MVQYITYIKYSIEISLKILLLGLCNNFRNSLWFCAAYVKRCAMCSTRYTNKIWIYFSIIVFMRTTTRLHGPKPSGPDNNQIEILAAHQDDRVVRDFRSSRCHARWKRLFKTYHSEWIDNVSWFYFTKFLIY